MWKRMARAALVTVVLSVLSLSCMPKVKEAMEGAESALDEAEAAGAPSKYPELYEAAQDYFKQGERQRFLWRWNLSRFQFEASRRAGEIAALYARGQGAGTCAPCLAPPGDESRADCPPCPPKDLSWSPPSDGAGMCCDDYEACAANARGLEKRLAACDRPRAVYVADESCPRCPETKCDPGAGDKKSGAAYDQLLLGMFTVTPPAMIEQGKSDYEVVVKFTGSVLDDKDAGAARVMNDYRVLLDVPGVEPPEVTVGSPTADYEPLTAHGGEWRLPLNVPDGISGPVKITVDFMMFNPVSGKEMKLPPALVTIPAAGACPPAKPCPEVTIEPSAAAPPGTSWGLALALLVVGLGVGAGAGFALFGRKKAGKTISSGS